MPNWLLISIVGSIALTLVLNLLPVLFPRATRRAQERIVRDIRRHEERMDTPEPGPRIRVFFPWRFMLIASIILTLLINLIAWLARS